MERNGTEWNGTEWNGMERNVLGGYHLAPTACKIFLSRNVKRIK